jgi:putative endonuclease
VNQAPPRSTPDPRRALGRRGEDLALAHYQRLGFELVERNHRTREGEIDLIVCDGRTLVFVEVKTRRIQRSAAGTATGMAARELAPLQWLRARQLARLRRASVRWLGATPGRPRASELRFDAVGVVVDGSGRLLRIDQVEGA